jgi:Holliday junction resolvasome RuvABC endonuclease subunit
MIIAGLDLSLTSSGIVKFLLNDNLCVESNSWLGFTDIIKIAKLYPNNLCFYKIGKNGIDNYIDRSNFMLYTINRYLDDVNYIAIEDYSYNSTGKNYHIGGFIEQVKKDFYYKNVPIRLYDITSIKKFATGNGNADKIMICDHFNVVDSMRIDISKLPEYKSPKTDIVDAWYITCLLLLELKLRKGLISLKELDQNEISIFNRVTKSNPVNLLDRPFMKKGEIF